MDDTDRIDEREFAEENVITFSGEEENSIFLKELQDRCLHGTPEEQRDAAFVLNAIQVKQIIAAAEAGHTLSMESLASWYEHGHFVRSDPKMAAMWRERAEESRRRNNGKAVKPARAFISEKLALHYRTDGYDDRNAFPDSDFADRDPLPEEASEMFQSFVETLLAKTEVRVPDDAADLTKMAADPNSDDDRYIVYLLRKLSACSNPTIAGRAFCSLGDSYALGRGVNVSHVNAFDYYRRAAELGNPRAMAALCRCYQNGIGTRNDDHLGFTWAVKSADAGWVGGDARVASCYFMGLGTERNPTKAFRYAKKASRQGHPEGIRFMGLCYLLGIGTEQDRNKAMRWFKRGADVGEQRCANHYQDLKSGRPFRFI